MVKFLDFSSRCASFQSMKLIMYVLSFGCCTTTLKQELVEGVLPSRFSGVTHTDTLASVIIFIFTNSSKDFLTGSLNLNVIMHLSMNTGSPCTCKLVGVILMPLFASAHSFSRWNIRACRSTSSNENLLFSITVASNPKIVGPSSRTRKWSL